MNSLQTLSWERSSRNATSLARRSSAVGQATCAEFSYALYTSLWTTMSVSALAGQTLFVNSARAQSGVRSIRHTPSCAWRSTHACSTSLPPRAEHSAQATGPAQALYSGRPPARHPALSTHPLVPNSTSSARARVCRRLSSSSREMTCRHRWREGRACASNERHCTKGSTETLYTCMATALS